MYCRQQAEVGGWTLHLDAPAPDPRTPRAVERTCFRILQQGLSKIMQFAQATEVWVEVHHGADELELRIRDNGGGFNCDREDHGHMGAGLELFAMQMRAKRVGGSVDIKSVAGARSEMPAVLPFAIESVQPVQSAEPA